MCFSVQIERDLEKLASRFHATVSLTDFEKLRHLKDWSEQVPPERLKEVLGLKRQPSSSPFKSADAEGRIYPGYFAPVIVWENNQRVIKPMRYRVRPRGSREEIPSQYNVFNARSDALLTRKTWKGLFTKSHGLFPFLRFFEWVERDGKKALISFKPNNHKIMWAPMIFDTWKASEAFPSLLSAAADPNSVEVEFQSFALITKDPPAEVLAAGHDRCPIFMEEKNIDLWLQADNLTEEMAFGLLNQTETTHFQMEPSTR